MAKKKKRGMGRPLVYGDRTRQFSVSLPKSMIAKLDEIAEARGMSRSEVVVRMLSQCRQLKDIRSLSSR